MMHRAAVWVPVEVRRLIADMKVSERDRLAFHELTVLRSDSGELPSVGLIACHWFGVLRAAVSTQRAEAIVARLIEAGLVERTEAGLRLAQPQLYFGGATSIPDQMGTDTAIPAESADERRRRQAASRKRRQRQRDGHAPNVTPQRDQKPVAGVTERDGSVTCHAPGFLPHTPSFLDLSENKSPLPPYCGAERDIQRDIQALGVTPEFDFEALAAELVAAHPSPRPGRRNNLVVQALLQVWTDCGRDLERMALLRKNTLAWCAYWHANGFASNLPRWIREYGWLTGPPAQKVAPTTESGPRHDVIDWAAVEVAS